jgi:tetratricopeptide (TPR) repeat protein
MKLPVKISLALLLLAPALINAQDAAFLIDSAKKLELKFKEEKAYELYKQANTIKPTVETNTKLAELSLNIGARQADPLQKIDFYKKAQTYANAASWIDSANADVLYTTALVYDKLYGAEEKKELIAEDIRLTRYFINKAIAANPNNGRYYHLLGHWHLELLNLNPVKKAAVRILYGSLPPASIDSAIAYMEKSKSMEQYYCWNFYDLGRAYSFNRQYEKAMAVLQQLAKLPTRRQDDIEIKKQGAILLQQLN